MAGGDGAGCPALPGAPRTVTDELQRVLNAAARVITEPPPGALPLDPAWGLPSRRPPVPYLQILATPLLFNTRSWQVFSS